MQTPEFLLISKHKSRALGLIPCTYVDRTVSPWMGHEKNSDCCYLFDSHSTY